MYVTQGLKRAHQVQGKGVATFCKGVSRSWEQVTDRVQRLASALQSLGAQTDDRIAVLALNCDRYLEILYATPWAGTIVVPINYRLTPPEVLHIMQDSEASILFVDATLKPLVQAIQESCPCLKHVIFMDNEAAPDGWLEYEKLINEKAPIEDALRGYDDLYGLFYTGGTTGRSKGVMLTHSNICSNALPVSSNMQYESHTRYLHAAPMFHAADCGSTFAITMVGGAHHFIDRFDPKATLAQIDAEGITATMFVPTMMNMMVKHPEANNYHLKSLTHIVYGASPMPTALMEQLLQTWSGVQFVGCLGMTEMSPVITCLRAPDHYLGNPKLGSVGPCAYNVEVRIVDAKDQDLPAGEIGQILCRGTPLMKGYWKQPELTAETLKGGWMHTGDAGYMDEDGYIFVVDRVKDMIITGGENVYSQEVESAIFKHPAVKECAVIGLPHDIWGECVHAVVVPKPDTQLTGEEIIAHCKNLLAGYKCPSSVDIRHEPLPLSGAAKVLKTQLREAYACNSSS